MNTKQAHLRQWKTELFTEQKEKKALEAMNAEHHPEDPLTASLQRHSHPHHDHHAHNTKRYRVEVY